MGGNASSEVRMHIVGANGVGATDRGKPLETEAREGGIIEEIRLEAAVRNPQCSASMLDLILYEKCRAESHLSLLLNTTVTAVEMHGTEISRAIAERQSTQDRFKISAKVFVDCTGDGRLGAEAGAAFMEGRESREQFGESLAPEKADHFRLGSSLMMQARRHEPPVPFTAPPWARKFTKGDLRLRWYANPGDERPTLEYGFWWAEWGGVHDTIKENEMIRDELQAVVLGIWDHIKNGPPEGGEPHPDADHWALDWIGFVPGKRESRRFIGQHVLTQDHVLQSHPMPDAIAYGGWPLDLHPPEGVDVPDQSPCVQHPVPRLYDIPLRACVARDIPNLMFAGRNISATHVAFASTRVMATCALVGQGVGTAAAVSVKQKIPPGKLASNPEALGIIQQQLLRDDAYLIGITNQDPADLARTASMSASSETPSAPANSVLSGQTRSVHGERGAPELRSNPGTHRWISSPEQELPAWIELSWQTEITMGQVELIFDTGLHRHLTLTHHHGYKSTMQWGQAQSETVRDYEIQAFQSGNWVTLLSVEKNYQRRRIHPLPQPVVCQSMRIMVSATGGSLSARICEIRVYESVST